MPNQGVLEAFLLGCQVELWGGATLGDLCQSTGWEARELTFFTEGTALFLDVGTWRRMWKGESPVLFTACVSPAPFHLCRLRLFFSFPPHSFSPL